MRAVHGGKQEVGMNHAFATDNGALDSIVQRRHAESELHINGDARTTHHWAALIWTQISDESVQQN